MCVGLDVDLLTLQLIPPNQSSLFSIFTRLNIFCVVRTVRGA